MQQAASGWQPLKRKLPKAWWQTKPEYDRQPPIDNDLSTDTAAIINDLSTPQPENKGTKKNFKKLGKLAAHFDKKHVRDQQELTALYATFRENMALTARMEEAELAVQEAAWTFSEAVRALNIVNAQLDRGPAEIADIVAHKCVGQATLDQSYTAENKRYYTELAAKQHQSHTDERQK